MTASAVKDVRQQQLAQQGNKCALCKLPGTATDAVLDHCHKTGAIRGTLHRGCNSLLGTVENNAARYGVKNLQAFLHGCAGYVQLHTTNITGLIHPTHKTDDEKRVIRNVKAVKARLKKRTA